MIDWVLSKYRLPTITEQDGYEESLRLRVDRLILRGLEKHGVEAHIEESTYDLVAGDSKLVELDQWRLSIVDHSRVHRVYATAGGEELEISVDLTSKPKVRIKKLLTHLQGDAKK